MRVGRLLLPSSVAGAQEDDVPLPDAARRARDPREFRRADERIGRQRAQIEHRRFTDQLLQRQAAQVAPLGKTVVGRFDVRANVAELSAPGA